MATIPMSGQGTIFGMGMGTAAGMMPGSNPAQARAQRNRELFDLQKRCAPRPDS